MSLVAGVDCSTQGTKVLVVDTDDGHVVATGTAVHEVHGEGGARETDPRVWEGALVTALAQTGLAGEVRALSVGAQQHGLVVLDGQGQPLRPAPLWNDTRSAPDALALVNALGGPETAAKRTGSVPTAAFTVSHWAWLRRTEPEVAAAAAHVMLPHDYMNFRLTGVPTTDRSDVSGSGWWSPNEEAYAPDVLALDEVRLNQRLLPEVLGPNASAGTVTAQAAERFGLAPGTQVACGAGDNASAALPLVLAPGEAAMSLGTSGTVYAVAGSPSSDPSGTVAGFVATGATGFSNAIALACSAGTTCVFSTNPVFVGQPTTLTVSNLESVWNPLPSRFLKDRIQIFPSQGIKYWM